MAEAVLFLVLWNVLETAGKGTVAQSNAQTSPYTQDLSNKQRGDFNSIYFEYQEQSIQC